MPNVTPSLPRPTLSRRILLAGTAGTLVLSALPGARVDARREKPAPALETMIDILQRLPGALVNPEDPGFVFTHVDLAAQWEAVDLPAYDPASGPPSRDYVDALSMLPLRMRPFLYSLDDEFVQLIGFHPFAVTQALEVGNGSTRATLLRGGFDATTIHTAWEAAGYAPMETSSGVAAWSSGPNGEFTPDDPLQRRTTGALNNVAILNDEWLLFTRTFAQLETIVAFAESAGDDSLFAIPGVRETIAQLDDRTVAAVAISGDLLTPAQTFPQGTEAPDSLMKADAEFGPLPAASLLVTAVTGGLRPLADGEDLDVLNDVVVQARLALKEGADNGSEAKAAAKTIAGRWESLDSIVAKVPYTKFLAVIDANGQNEVAIVDFAIAGSPAFWSRMIEQRDWLPFVTTAEAS